MMMLVYMMLLLMRPPSSFGNTRIQPRSLIQTLRIDISPIFARIAMHMLAQQALANTAEASLQAVWLETPVPGLFLVAHRIATTPHGEADHRWIRLRPGTTHKNLPSLMAVLARDLQMAVVEVA